MVKGLFDRFIRRRESPVLIDASGTADGWVEFTNGQMAVHDPKGDGRYATLIPEPGVWLWINGEEVRDPTAVTASDRIRVEVAKDHVNFFDLRIAADEMCVELRLIADPFRLADGFEIVGRHQVRIQPRCSSKAKSRLVPPKQLIVERLMKLGVEFGVDHDRIEQELAEQTFQPVIIAQGQEAVPPVPGHWNWRLDEWSLVQAGQLIATYHGGQPQRPRINVRGKVSKPFDEPPQVPFFLAGNQTRLVSSGRLVASASGRARVVPTPQGERVDIFAVQIIEGDLEGELQTEADVIVKGDLRCARVSKVGELLVVGNVTQSEINATVITIRGQVRESLLCSVPQGHCVVLNAEFSWIRDRLEQMRGSLHNNQRITDEEFMAVTYFVGQMLARTEQMGVRHPEYLQFLSELANVFMGSQLVTGFDLSAAGRLILTLSRVIKACEQVLTAGHDVTAGSLEKSQIWAGRDVWVDQTVNQTTIYAGGSIRLSADEEVAGSELVSGEAIYAGHLQSGDVAEQGVLARAPHIEASGVQRGCALEFGITRKEMVTKMGRVVATATAAGELIVRPLEP